MKQQKKGIIDVKVGTPESVHKDKTGHLLVVAAPWFFIFIIEDILRTKRNYIK